MKAKAEQVRRAGQTRRVPGSMLQTERRVSPVPEITGSQEYTEEGGCWIGWVIRMVGQKPTWWKPKRKREEIQPAYLPS